MPNLAMLYKIPWFPTEKILTECQQTVIVTFLTNQGAAKVGSSKYEISIKSFIYQFNTYMVYIM